MSKKKTAAPAAAEHENPGIRERREQAERMDMALRFTAATEVLNGMLSNADFMSRLLADLRGNNGLGFEQARAKMRKILISESVMMADELLDELGKEIS